MGAYPAALFVVTLLCIHHIYAADIGTASKNATLQQYVDSYEAEGEPQQVSGEASAYSGSQQSYELCPDPQPADSFKQGDSTATIETPPTDAFRVPTLAVEA